jgi:hypothetical protein
VAQTLATWYYGIILACAILLYLVVLLVMRRKTYTIKWTLTLVVCLAVAGAVIAPFAVPYLKIHSEDPRFVRDINEVDLFSADIRDFAISSEQNWIWGNATAGLRKTTVKRGGPTERTLFPGMMPLVLGIIGAVMLFMRGKDNERFYVRYYVALGAFGVVMCLGTTLNIFGHSYNIPMPYDLFFYVFPGFKVMRVPARFIILVILALAVLSGFCVRAVLTWVTARRSAALGALVALAIIALVVLDLMSVALPMHEVPLKQDFPKVYKWLAQQKGDVPVAELPLANYRRRTFEAGLQYEPTWLEREPMRTYYSTLHWKKMLNGYSGFIPSSYYEAVATTAGFPSVESIAWLKATGIKYVIVHARLTDPVTLEKIFKWSLKKKGGLTPWKVFDNNRKKGDIDYVYKLQ